MASPPPLSLDGTLGEVQIALVLATWLFGIETLQTWNYYRDFPTDGKALKGLVAVIWFLELGHTIACWHSMYLVTVTFYGRPEHILSPPLSMVFVILLHAFIAIGVQTFFVYRVWVLSGKWPIPILCCFLNLLRLGCNVLLFVDLSKHRLYSRLTTDLRWEVILMDTINPAVDIIIAASLVYYLWGRRKSDFKQTNRMVDTIIVWTLERTLLTTATGIMQLVLYLARDDLSWLIFFLIQGKLFSNSMLASLNGRTHFRSVPNGSNGSTAIGFNSTTVATGNQNAVLPMHRLSATAHSQDSQDVFPIVKEI